MITQLQWWRQNAEPCNHRSDRVREVDCTRPHPAPADHSVNRRPCVWAAVGSAPPAAAASPRGAPPAPPRLHHPAAAAAAPPSLRHRSLVLSIESSDPKAKMLVVTMLLQRSSSGELRCCYLQSKLMQLLM